MNWTIRLSKDAAKQLSHIARTQQEIILARLAEMEEDPFRGDVKPLQGPQWRGRFRKRVGRWRIIFTPLHNDRLVEVSAILLRSEETYR
jgi:mRNA-degrading endonuclease RelE of RelBE toxin-antitoxin system